MFSPYIAVSHNAIDLVSWKVESFHYLLYSEVFVTILGKWVHGFLDSRAQIVGNSIFLLVWYLVT